MKVSFSMTRKIVFINQATGYLTIDIINKFAEEYDEVALIAGSIRVQNIQLDPVVRVSHIVRYNRGNTFRKALSWLTGTIQIYFLLTFRYKDFEKFFFTIPPTAYLLSLKFKSLFSIVVYDMFPEALKVYGFNENGMLYKWWSEKNKKIFQNAHRVYTLSENMKSKLLDYSTNIDVRVISNWSAFSGFLPIKKDQNLIIHREGLNNKFIIQYSGNIGVTHNVETLIEVAEILKLHMDLEFQIIGRGERTNTIMELIKKKELANCRLLPFRKDEELFESLCAADLSVITLDDKAPDISVPSKAYNIMAAGVPMMAIAALNSSLSDIISQYQTGRTFDKGDIEGMCRFILELKNNSAYYNQLASNSLKASQSFTNANAVKYFELYHE
jgi:glycosyltransferase involved in cell wall biosynthesis